VTDLDPSIIHDYEKWLHAAANRIGRPEDHDDLVQEGRVAMWRALESYNEDLGALPSWLVRAAENRLKDLAWGKGQPTGHEAVRGKRQVEEVVSVDSMEADEVDGLMGYVEEAYHDGEIIDAIRHLTPKQQEYVFLRFWGGLDPTSRSPEMKALVSQYPVMAERWHWQRAKAILVDELSDFRR
jgi:RNA polymerase sigma factor (sigma-70 family)